jgi:acetolactate synthase-1/2/3 large subunit
VVDDITEMPDKVREAFAIATEGRPGPVLIDIPKDVQNQKMEWDVVATGVKPRSFKADRASAQPPAGLDAAAQLIDAAARPLLMIGHGVILGNAYAEVQAFAEKTGMPIITTLLGISAIPESHPLHLGMPGMHGEVHVNRAIQHADVIVGIGLRFDDRVTGNTAAFAPQAKIIHLDLDPAEIGKNVPVAVALVGQARDLTTRLAELVRPRNCDAWRDEIRGFMRERAENYRGDMSPETILTAIREGSGPGCTVVADVGQHQMWVAKLFGYEERNSHISSGGLGTMGFAVPAAVGVHFARPDRPVWAISGDGGFQMNMQEIATMVQEGIPVKMAIFNNGYLGMVRQWQQFFHGRRYSATPIWSPDYVKLAEAYGIAGYRVENARQIDEAVARAVRDPGPALLEFMIEQEANVFPMIPPGGSLSEPIESAPAVVPVP